MLGRVLIHTWIPFTSQQFGVDYCSVDCCVGDCGYTREETEMAVMKSALPSIAIPEPDNLACYIMKGFHGYGNRAALINAATGEEYTYKQLRHYAERVASGLSKRGFCRADVLAIYSYNISEYAIAVLATLLLGGTVTTINPLYTEDEVLFQLKDTSARWLVTIPESIKTAANAARKHHAIKELFVFGEPNGFTAFRKLMEDDGSCFCAPVRSNCREHTAVLLYSSGTTGLPKGVMLTTFNLIAAMEVMNATTDALTRQMREPPSQTELGLLPFYHASGFTATLLNSMTMGSTLVILSRFQPEVFLETIQNYKINRITLVPPLAVFMAKHPLVDKYDMSHIQLILCGAAPLSRELAETLLSRLGGKAKHSLCQGYGMTETTLLTHVMMDINSTKYASVGNLVANTMCKITDVETGQTLPAGKEGEVCIKGPQIMKGYLNNPATTAFTLDKEGWIHTGDVGYVDEDECLYIVDRIKELIKYKAYQVAPAELEAKLLHHPSVADAAVIGVPDEEAGELPKAYVVRSDQNLLAEDLHSYLREHVAPQKRLRGGIEFVSEIPKSASGKILRRQLRARNKKLSRL